MLNKLNEQVDKKKTSERIHKQNRKINKDLKTMKKSQTLFMKLKNIIPELKIQKDLTTDLTRQMAKIKSECLKMGI